MHILLGLLAAIGGIIFVLYRVTNSYRMGKDALQDGREMLQDGKALVRRSQWKAKQRSGNPVNEITDPREVATVLLLETAKLKGEITQSQKTEIRSLMVSHFQLPLEDAQEMMTTVTYLTQNVPDVENILVKILRPVIERLTTQERADLIAMLQQVAAVDGEPNMDQQRFIGIIKSKILA